MATERTSSEGRRIRSDSAVFDAAASVLESLGGRLREAQRSHGDLRQYLVDLGHQAAQLLAVHQADPGAGADLTRLVGESLAAGGTLLGQVIDDHDTATGHFANRMPVLVASGWLGDLFGDPLGARPDDPLDDISLLGVKDADDIQEVASTRAQTTFDGAGIVDGHGMPSGTRTGTPC